MGNDTTTEQFAPAELAAFAYDAVWLLAAALDVKNVSLNHKYAVNDILDYLSVEDHYGVSGPIAFGGAGWRIATQAYVTLYREGTNKSLQKVLVGIVRNLHNIKGGNQPQFVYINNESASTVWPGL